MARILFVDDDESVRESTAILLGFDHEVVAASNLNDAKAAFDGSHFDVVLTDLNYLGNSRDKTGLQLIDYVLSKNPKQRCILASGTSSNLSQSERDGLLARGVLIVDKPYDETQMNAAINGTLPSGGTSATVPSGAPNGGNAFAKIIKPQT